MDIKVGKFTLETLTTGMYDTPKDIYREYIQNAVDSIDNAIKSGVLKPGKDCVRIKIDKEKSYISISDNGTGVGSTNIADCLLNIGDSTKLNSDNRGFRGIGRLAGLAYCDELIFSTSSNNEEVKTVVKLDAKELRKSLYSLESNGSLEEIFLNIVTVSREHEAKGKHYFTVEMKGVENVGEILDCSQIYKYLAQVAPVPFSTEFKWQYIVESKLRYRGLDISKYNIYLEGDSIYEKVYKKYSDVFVSDRVRKVEDKIDDIEERVFYDNENRALAVLWYAKTNYCGTIQDETIKGIRLRKGNIQLGDKSVLNAIFKDERFNGWLIGELHIISQQLIPNARRDNIEKSSIYYELLKQLKDWADRVSSLIRKTSILRNSEKSNKQIEKVLEAANNDRLTNIEVKKIPELIIQEKQEYDAVAHEELINKLDILIKEKKAYTKYQALNLQTGITIEEKKILAAVFDIIQEKQSLSVEGLISTIIREYKSKTTSNRQ